jgi:hypothetical protein
MDKVLVKNGAYCGRTMNGEFMMIGDWTPNNKPQGGHITVIDNGQTMRINVRKEDVGCTLAPESFEDLAAKIAGRFRIMERLTMGSINGTITALAISGAPGVGKTFTVEKMLKRAAEEGDISFVHIKGRMSAPGLYRQLYANSDANSVILIDDCDDIFKDESAMNILKSALDSSDERWVSWNTESLSFKEDKIPTTFKFKGTVIFITNKDFQAIIDAGGSMAPHMEAIISRAVYLDLALHDRKSIMAHVENLAFTTPMLFSKGITHDQVTTAINWLKENCEDLRTLCNRTAQKLAQFIATDDEWEEVARITLLRKP